MQEEITALFIGVDWWTEQLFRYYNYYTILGVTIF